MTRKQLIAIVTLCTLTLQSALADTFDHSAWNKLLGDHVVADNGGRQTWVDYQGIQGDEQILDHYLEQLAAIEASQFERWPQTNQLAFLINAYNAWTVKLILTVWPNLESIKDTGGIFSSPWSRKFVNLLGNKRSLDDIEHKLIRGSGAYNDPRIHFAVNCASIGCPALRPEAYIGQRLDDQLDEQTRLFLMDTSRNRIKRNTIELSSIFKWYRKDFEKGWLGYHSLEDFLLAHAQTLGLSQSMITQLQRGDIDIEFLDYDWRLNEKR